jgi:16S rRNA (uracil1498-N3)-methyltransferase
MHRLSTDLPPSIQPGAMVVIDGDEAHHAVSVKRLRPGESVQLLDGRGGVADGVVDAIDPGRGRHSAAIRVRVEALRQLPPLSPALRVWSAAPKGDRLEQMIGQLAQVGAASWGFLHTQRGVVDPGEHKANRLERIALEAGKQCGRAHKLALEQPRQLADFTGPSTIVADASGQPGVAVPPRAAAADLLVGPEGGWAPQELDQLRAAGATIARFGPHVMRIETAAVVAAAMLITSVADTAAIPA